MSNRKAKSTSFYLTEDCLGLLRILADRMGISKSSIIEVLVRKKAKEEGVRDVPRT